MQPPTGGLPAPAPYDTTAPLYSKATAITWTSPEHDLVKKAPRPVVEEVENFDEFDGMGSIFGWFMEAGEDKVSWSWLVHDPPCGHVIDKPVLL